MRILLVAVLLGLAAVTSAATKPGPAPITPAAQDIALGSLRLTSLRDAAFNSPNDGKTFGVDVGPAAVAKLLAASKRPTDRIELSVDALLVRGLPGHVVLIDTGLGPKAGGALAQSLARAGVSPAEVTDVLITHSHGDHVGGLLGTDGRSAFSKAAVRMAAAEWTWLQSQPGSKALVDAISGQVRTFEPGTAAAPGIASIALRGHTPGHVGYQIRSGRASLLDIGDTAHSSLVSLAHPEWAMGFDNDDATARATRRVELARFARERTLIFSPHFPFPGFGRVVAQGRGYAWRPTRKWSAAKAAGAKPVLSASPEVATPGGYKKDPCVDGSPLARMFRRFA